MTRELVQVRLRTHAKVNLFLRVVGARHDGFHEIVTILHGIEFGDDIEVTLTDTGEIEVEIEMAEGNVGHPPVAEENIAYAAAQKLIARGAKYEGLRIHMVKHIPIGAGLGGGSGNAAGVIVALNELWRMELGRPQILDVAGMVGSDVPFCIEGGTALATARGEKLTPLPAPDQMWFVLGLSRDGLLTKDVYGMFDDMGIRVETSPSPMTLALGAGDPKEIAECLHNDLEGAASRMHPELETRKEAMMSAGALGAGMSGSGPTLFAIARDEDNARGIAGELEEHFESVRVTRSRAQCIERLD